MHDDRVHLTSDRGGRKPRPGRRSPRCKLIATVLLVGACQLSACGASGGPSARDSSGSSDTSTTPTQSTKPQVPCSNPEGGNCLGALARGTYKTVEFQPALTYQVPTGWANFEDTPGNFLLLPPGGTLAGVNAATSDYIGVYSSVAAPNGCNPGTAPGVGHSASDIAAWMNARPGLAATAPQSVSLGGLRGVTLDVRMAKGWTKSCPYGHGRPLVPLIVGVDRSGLDHNVLAGLAVRLYLLGVSGGTLAIEVDDLSGGAHLNMYSRVVENMKFAAS